MRPIYSSTFWTYPDASPKTCRRLYVCMGPTTVPCTSCINCKCFTQEMTSCLKATVFHPTKSEIFIEVLLWRWSLKHWLSFMLLVSCVVCNLNLKILRKILPWHVFWQCVIDNESHSARFCDSVRIEMKVQCSIMYLLFYI